MLNTNWRWRESGITLGVISSLVFGANGAVAQLIPDDTLGAEGSVVTPEQLRDLIEGGAIRDGNLFHSFLEFNVDAGREVFFANPAGIINILTRVTGGNVSNIFGTLGVDGAANLFLINPNGIVFGEGAALDVSGSFLATTAESVVFGDGFEFSATNPGAPPLITINIPVGLQYGGNPGDIVNQSTFKITVPNEENPNSADGLRVNEGQSLLLVGGDVHLEGGSLRAPGGRIEIGGLAEAGTVGLNIDGSSISLSFPDGVTRGDVSFTAPGEIIPEVDVTAGGGGDIAIHARNIDILDGSDICAGIGADANCGGLAKDFGSPSAQAGNILLDAQETVTIANQVSVVGNQVNLGAFGNAGNINIQTGSLFVNDGGQLSNASLGQGNAGNINISAREQVSVADSGSRIFNFLNANSFGSAGSISINADTLNLQDSAIIAIFTSGQGDTGDLLIQADDSVNISNGGFLTNQVNLGVGNSGDINIQTRQLSITEGASIESVTRGQGNSGNISINTQQFIGTENSLVASFVDGGNGNAGNLEIVASDYIELSGHSDLTTQVNSEGQGNAGDLTIETGSLTLRDNGTQITTTTFGIGNAGDMIVRVSGAIEIIGEDVDVTDSLLTGLSTSVAEGAVGDAGNLFIQAQSLTLTDTAQIQSDAFRAFRGDVPGQGQGGNIQIDVTDFILITGASLDDGASSGIFASVDTGATGPGGDVTINANSLTVSDGGIITSQTRGAQNGGNITINANSFEASGGGQVVATTSGSGAAGNITLNIADSVTLSGQDPTFTERFNRFAISDPGLVLNAGSASGLFVSGNADSTGDSGAITVNTDILNLDDGAEISAQNQGSGRAGNISLMADAITLRDNSNITTNVNSFNGADGGGNITIDTTILAGSGDSDITANAVQGNAGIIEITADAVFGLEVRDELTEQSDITAFSEQDPSLDGQVIFTTPEVDSTSEIPNLPTDVIDAPNLIASTCPRNPQEARIAQQDEFIVTGRGGLPPNPEEPLRRSGVLVDLVTLSEDAERGDAVTRGLEEENNQPIKEAQGWVRNADGKVVLTAAPQPSNSDIPWLAAYNCN